VANSDQQRRVEDRLPEPIEPLIRPRPVPPGTGGRSCIDARAAVEGVLGGLDTGCRWRDLPERGLGVRAIHSGRLGEWQEVRVWEDPSPLLR
jgi:transposase